MCDSYLVTGRFMSGAEVVGYHLSGCDGSTVDITKDKAIVMISKGLIDNMRIQYSGDEVIIRGKGVNLNSLPVYDLNKAHMRHGNAQNNINRQLKIIKVIMFKSASVGYVLQGPNGVNVKLSRMKTIELAIKGQISNADAYKYQVTETSEPQIVLRGVNCDLRNLPIVKIDESGNVIDSSDSKKIAYVRLAKVNSAGILYCETDKKAYTFSVGDYLICTQSGKIITMHASNAKNIVKSTKTEVIGDVYIENVKDYSIEFLGKNKIQVTPKLVLSWKIAGITKD